MAKDRKTFNVEIHRFKQSGKYYDTDDELARSAPNAGTPIADDDTPPADKAAI